MSGDPQDAPACNGLTVPVSALPAACYFDPARHTREMVTLWRNNWLYVARSEVLTEPGAFRTLSIGDQNYLVVRGRGGSLRGFYNTCRPPRLVAVRGR